jgi:hypothetical protein
MTHRNRPEQVLHGTIIAHLEARAAPGIFYFHCPNGGWRSPHEAAILKALGVVSGVPDLIFLRDGQFFSLELKAPGRKPTTNQKAVHTAIEAAGGVVAVADNLDTAIRQLECWGLLKGKTQ